MINKAYRPNDPWMALVYAIVDRAADDYRTVLRSVMRAPTVKVKKQQRELERFFRSLWFEALTGADGVFLMQHIRNEAGYHANKA